MLLLGDDSDGVSMGVDTLPPHAVLRAGSNRFVHGTYISDIAYLDPKRIVTFGKADAKVWYEPTGQMLVRIADGGEVADRFASGPLALTLTRDPQRSRDVEFRTWNLLSGTSDKSFRHESLVYSASISEDGKLIAVAHTDWSIHLLDGEIGEVLVSLPPLDSRIGHGGFPLVYLSGDGCVLVIVDLADPKNNVRRYRFRQVDEGPKIGKELSCVEFQGHCRLKAIEDRDEAILVGINGEVLIYDFRDGKEILRVRHGRVSALGAAVDPQHRVLATCGADGYIRIWDIATGTETRAIDTGERHPWCVTFSPDDRTLASGGGHGRVRFWDIATGKELRLQEGDLDTGGICSVAISPDGRTMATAGELGLVSLWETRTGRLLGTLQWQLPPELAE